jgi:hypothetical protein
MLRSSGNRMVNPECLESAFVSKAFGVVTGAFRNLVKAA